MSQSSHNLFTVKFNLRELLNKLGSENDHSLHYSYYQRSFEAVGFSVLAYIVQRGWYSCGGKMAFSSRSPVQHEVYIFELRLVLISGTKHFLHESLAL